MFGGGCGVEDDGVWGVCVQTVEFMYTLWVSSIHVYKWILLFYFF